MKELYCKAGACLASFCTLNPRQPSSRQLWREGQPGRPPDVVRSSFMLLIVCTTPSDTSKS
jgi:hypothetical protein